MSLGSWASDTLAKATGEGAHGTGDEQSYWEKALEEAKKYQDVPEATAPSSSSSTASPSAGAGGAVAPVAATQGGGAMLGGFRLFGLDPITLALLAAAGYLVWRGRK